MFMINHFLDKLFVGQPVPFVERLNETNAVEGPGSLGAHVQTCREVHGRAPNFLLVDVSCLLACVSRDVMLIFSIDAVL